MIFWTPGNTILLLLSPILANAASSTAGLLKYVDGIASPHVIVKPLLSIQMLDTNDSHSMDVSGGCRDASLHKCGSSMVRIFHLLDYLPEPGAFDGKCTLRKAFFHCLRGEDYSRCRKRHWKWTGDARFRKRLAQTLWATRGCILRALPNGTHV